MRQLLMVGLIGIFLSCTPTAWAKKAVQLSIATGDKGGLYYPLGNSMSNILSKYVPYAEATAEVTSGSVSNCLLVKKEKADLAFTMADAAWDAYQGKAPFKEKIPLRTLAVLYPNHMHIVALEDKGIEKVADLKGKRVSTGAPGSGTEVMALRILAAYGLNADKDMTRDRLSVSEAASALRDGKIDAFFWAGGLPTTAVADLASPPRGKMKLIGHADAIPKMRKMYGPFYVAGIIPSNTYLGQNQNVSIAVVWNLLVCNENMKENVAFDIVKALFDHKPELVLSHPEAKYISLEPQAAGGSPIPFHPGSFRYFTEKGLQMK